MKLQKLTLFLSNGENVYHLDGNIKTTMDTKIKIKNVSIFWRFNNIVKNKNDSIHLVDSEGNNTILTFKQGYWTFSQFQKKLAEYEINLIQDLHSYICILKSKKYTIHLKEFGRLLGFEKNAVIPLNTLKKSPQNVDVNLELRYVTISGDMVDSTLNYNQQGKKSKVIATFPLTSEQHLNGTVTFFYKTENIVEVNNGVYNRLVFNVDTNIEEKVELNILCERYLY